MALSGRHNAQLSFSDFWCLGGTPRAQRPAEMQIIHPANSSLLAGSRGDLGRSSAGKFAAAKEQLYRDDFSVPSATSPTSVLSQDDPGQLHNSLYASNGLLNFVCERPAGSLKSDTESRDAPLAIVPWSIGFLPQTTSATVGGGSFPYKNFRAIDIGGGGSQRSGTSYPWKPLGAITLADQGAGSSTIIGIAADHRMADALNGMDDVAATMRGLKEEIRRWLQSEVISPPETKARDVPLQTVLCHVTEAHASRKSTQSHPIICTCAFSQAWARININTPSSTAKDLSPTSSSPSLSPSPRFGHTCTCSTSGISYEAAWAQVCGSDATESDVHLELPTSRKQLSKPVPLNPDMSTVSNLDMVLPRTPPPRPYKSLSKSPLGFIVRAPSARFTLADSALDSCPMPESLKSPLGSPFDRTLRSGLPPTPRGEGGRSGSLSRSSEKVKAWLDTGDLEIWNGPSPPQKPPHDGLKKANSARYRGWNSVGRSGPQLEEMLPDVLGWNSVGRSARSGRSGRRREDQIPTFSEWNLSSGSGRSGRSGRHREELPPSPLRRHPGEESGRSEKSGRSGRHKPVLVSTISLQEEYLKLLIHSSGDVAPPADAAPAVDVARPKSPLPPTSRHVRAHSFPNVVTFEDIMANVIKQ